MSKSPGFRAWYYFRQGWTVYFAFIMAAVNTLTVTYFLAIENYPILQDVFPSFIHYILVIGMIGVPLLIIIGYIHYHRTAAFSAEADVIAEAHPYNYKLPPNGWNQQVNYPFYLLLTKFMLKLNNNEKLTEQEIKEIQDVQTKINILLSGNFIHDPRSRNKTSD